MKCEEENPCKAIEGSEAHVKKEEKSRISLKTTWGVKGARRLPIPYNMIPEACAPNALADPDVLSKVNDSGMASKNVVQNCS